MSRAIGVFSLLLLLACGGGFEGEPASEPVEDWSFATEADAFAIASGEGEPVRVVLAHPLVLDGKLYIRAMTIFPVEDPALERILAEGRIQVSVDGTLHAGRVVRLETAAEIDPLLPELLRQSHMEATGARWDPEPETYPGTQMRQWWFRFEPDLAPAG